MAIGDVNSMRGGRHLQEYWPVCLCHLGLLPRVETCHQITSREWVSDWGLPYTLKVGTLGLSLPQFCVKL